MKSLEDQWNSTSLSTLMQNPHSLSHSTQLSRLAYSTKSVTMETIFYGSLPTIHGDVKLRIPFGNCKGKPSHVLYVINTFTDAKNMYVISIFKIPKSLFTWKKIIQNRPKLLEIAQTFWSWNILKTPRRFLFGLYYWKKSQFLYVHPRNWLFFEWESQK